LPLGETVSLTVAITAPSAGAHSAILNLHDPDTDAIVFRTLVAVVAAEPFGYADRTLHVSGALSLLATRAHYVSVPADMRAMTIELKVLRGSVRATVLPSHGLYPNYYGHVYPQGGRSFTPGIYHLTLPDPLPGTWTLTVENTTAWRESNQSLVSTEDAEYEMTARLLDASARPRPSRPGFLDISFENRGASLREPVVEASLGTLKSHQGKTLGTGLPNQFQIDVPPDTATLALQLRGVGASPRAFELYLYDCTTGECFSYNFTLPAEPSQRLVVRRPAAGRWIAAVNAAPVPQGGLPFELEEVVAMTPLPETATSGPRMPAARWTGTLRRPPITPAPLGAMRVLLIELLDHAVERDEAEHPWEIRSLLPKLRDRPTAVGVSIHRLP